MSAKFSPGLKNILIKKLTVELEEKMNLAEFNEVFLFLDRCNSILKIGTYGIFEKENLIALQDSTSGRIFNQWLDWKTGKIDKDFNKGRKLVRVFKNMVKEHKDVLAFNLGASNYFNISLTSLFVDYNESVLPFTFDVSDEDEFKKNLENLRDYLASIFFIDMVRDQMVIETIVSVFINEDVGNLIDTMVYQGSLYNKN